MRIESRIVQKHVHESEVIKSDLCSCIFPEEPIILKSEQIAQALPDEKIGLECVQAFISNMSAPNSLKELKQTKGVTLPENVLSASTNEWTVPRWAKAGDIVFFMHTKTARTSITKLRTELKRRKDRGREYGRMMSYIEHALAIHAQYGGKIFAIGRVSGAPEYEEVSAEESELYHWKSRCYARIDNIVPLSVPVDISEFNQFVYVTRGGATTPVLNEDFYDLRSVIANKNLIPAYLADSVARPVPLKEISKENWIRESNAYRRCFILERQFRTFYIDYLLRDIGDQKRFYTECRCQRADINDSSMDYVFKFNGKFLPVEAKLSVAAEPNIIGQVSKYVYNSKIILDKSRFIDYTDTHVGKVLVIDTDNIYVYDSGTSTMRIIFQLDQLKEKSDLEKIKEAIIKNIG